jgi:ATP-dependent helicase/nuclease subunit B
VNVGFKKDRTELLKNSLNTALTNEEFNAIKDYCTNILNIAVDEMLSGYISPKPYSLEGKTSCEYCEYKSLCAYTVETKGHREISTKKQKNSFSKED